MGVTTMMKVLDHLEEWIITFLMGGATVIIFFAVMHRYFAGVSIPVVQDWLLGINMGWAQELCIIMFVWMAKFGAAYGVRTGIHVGVDVLINRLEDRTRAKFILFGPAGRRDLHRHRRDARRPLHLGERHALRAVHRARPADGRPATRGRRRRIWNGQPGSSTRQCRSAPTSCASASCRSPGGSSARVSCRTTTTRRSRGSRRAEAGHQLVRAGQRPAPQDVRQQRIVGRSTTASGTTEGQP